METLPDYLAEGLDIVLVGLNPSAYSARVGHYFANPRNRFWAAFNRGGLAAEELTAETDHRMIEHGMGFTDVVKRPTPQGSGLTAEDYRRWAPVLKKKLEKFRPLIVCFHGMMAYRGYLWYAEGIRLKDATLGRQQRAIWSSKVFVVPNPSPANAKYSLEALAGWYRELEAFLREIKDK